MQRRAYHHALRSHFPSFLRATFHSLNPSQPFIPNWHLDALHEMIRYMDATPASRFIVNMPPRSLKSLALTVAWSAYLLGRDPATKIITASYSSAISIKHALDVRSLVTQPWFMHAFSDFQMMAGQNEKHKFVTTKHGFRLATSVGGSLTGEGGDVIIIDDPLNPAQAHSVHYRHRANQWFDHTLSSRLNDKHQGRMLLVMQRLHEDDLTGHLLHKGGWECVRLPALAQQPLSIAIGDWRKEMAAGELLQPKRETHALLEQLRRDLGSHAFQAQYLQQPTAQDGDVVRQEWLHEVSIMPDTFDYTLQSWDTAIKTGEQHDYSACVTIGVLAGMMYIRDVWAGRVDYPELKRAVLALAHRWKPNVVLIEDKASGQSLLQELRTEPSLTLIPIQPKGDKLTRVARITPMLEAAHVLFPRHASWMPALRDELLRFPHASHDDQVDALAQGVHWWRERHAAMQPSIRTL
ncbi:MAG: terminase [Alphaproteobacteria bacterium]|nr:MAG: terminase [Alphaproteobacteria bacterium]TAF38328.1 MAG: terminase [Alphaproteobacteria bacterium]TAF76794.1 MAG: terminase [Alphaproteobacteria bacterium]